MRKENLFKYDNDSIFVKTTNYYFLHISYPEIANYIMKKLQHYNKLINNYFQHYNRLLKLFSIKFILYDDFIHPNDLFYFR